MSVFDQYLRGIESFHLLTDHKPLVPLINTKYFDQTPLRCQRLLIRLMRYNAIAEYAPGKTLVIADTLSRSPLSNTEISASSQDLQNETQLNVDTVLLSRMSLSKMAHIHLATWEDPIVCQVLQYTKSG